MIMADELLNTVNKFFSLILIFLVTAINTWLIGNFLYWKNVFSKDKKCIITSIALSDILIGLFCLPVEASLYYEIYLGGPGCVLSYVEVYARFFSPFVYGIGITVLCIELVLRCKRISFYHINKFLTVFISSIPWLLAVIIVTPLIFSGASSTSCWYLPLNNHGLCIWSITTFLPILLFLVAWVITAFVKWEPSSSYSFGTSYSSWKDHTNSDIQQQGCPTSQSLIMDDRREGLDPQAANLANTETTTFNDSSPNSQPMVLNRSLVTTGDQTSRHEMQQLITISSPTQQGNFRPDEPTSGQQENKDQDIKRETLYLLIIILTYVVLTVPFALYNLVSLASLLYGNNLFTSTRTLVMLKWMQATRSLFIPLVWSLIYHIEKCKVNLF